MAWCCGGHAATPPLYVDGRLLQDGQRSQTCTAIGLSDTCCLTLTFLTMPFMLTFFLIIRCKPCLALVSVTVLSATTFFLAWLMFVEWLNWCALPPPPSPNVFLNGAVSFFSVPVSADARHRFAMHLQRYCPLHPLRAPEHGHVWIPRATPRGI